jgi:imidazolonepropionase-like amidohydrolase
MISGADEARRAVREQIGNGADLIKVYADWQYPTLTPEELRVIVEEAHKSRRRVAAHATTVEGIRNAVDAGVDSIEHGDAADRTTLELMKQRGIWLVPTLGVLVSMAASEKDEKIRAKIDEKIGGKHATLRVAREAGVRIASGYDASEAPAHGENARELVALAGAGYTNFEVIRAATLNGAELLGWQERIGSLDEGKLADIIAVRGNPLADVSVLQDVVFVMKGGAVVKDRRRDSAAR